MRGVSGFLWVSGGEFRILEAFSRVRGFRDRARALRICTWSRLLEEAGSDTQPDEKH